MSSNVNFAFVVMINARKNSIEPKTVFREFAYSMSCGERKFCEQTIQPIQVYN